MFLGTDQDNCDDKFLKGRDRPLKGTANGRAKLVEDDVLEIRRRYVRGSRLNGGPSLAREFGVSQAVISGIVRGEAWNHVCE